MKKFKWVIMLMPLALFISNAFADETDLKAASNGAGMTRMEKPSFDTAAAMGIDDTVPPAGIVTTAGGSGVYKPSN
ncbi:MAG: hypothetical protein OQL09_02970 [Gammaproteobacteria bacterium]|nr:hypothetical protein [Gammaproteobacteria bacterium]